VILHLRQAFVETPRARRAFNSIEDDDAVLGASARYDELWFALWTLANSMPDHSFARLDDALARDFARSGFNPSWLTLLLGAAATRPAEVDVSFAPRAWQAWTDLVGVAESPVIYEVQLSSQSSAEARGRISEFLGEFLRESRVGFSYRSWTYAHLRWWPRFARAVTPRSGLLVHGTSIYQQRGYPGTLGGFLLNHRGVYATTAAHVAPTMWEGVFQSADHDLVGPCVRIPQRPIGGDLLDETSLIESSMGGRYLESVEVSPINSVPVGEHVDFVGGTSGATTCEVSQYIAFRKVRFPDRDLMVRDGFELRSPAVTLFGASFRRPSAAGDSGAWVTSNGEDRIRWCGTIVGGDKISTVATFAANTTHILQDAGHERLEPYLTRPPGSLHQGARH
jgi:hypothetical protein